MQRLHGLIVLAATFGTSAEKVTGTLDYTFLPILYLVGVHVKLLGQFDQGSIAFQGRQCHLCLKLR